MPLDVALSRLSSPDRELRRTHAEAVTDGARAGPAHARLHLQHADARQGDRRPPARLLRPGSRAATSPTRPPTSRSRRSSQAVRAAYDIPQRWYRLKADAARASTGSPTTTAWRRCRAATRRSRSTTARDLVLTSFHEFSPVLGDTARRFFDERWIDAPVRPDKRGGAFCAYTVAVRAPVRDAQLHVAPPRRADARPRARPRPARGAGDPARRARAAHAADGLRDRVGVRRDARLRAAARRRARRRGRAWRCWPTRSRARSRPSSARPR